MSSTDPMKEHEVTELLQRYGDGQSACLDEVVVLVHDELRRIARQQLRRSSAGGHLETAVLVNEAYEKLARGRAQPFRDRRHFFAVASRAMRQIVVDLYRAGRTAKRGGKAPLVTLSSQLSVAQLDDPEQIVAVHQALDRLAEHDPELVEVLEMTCFGGLSNQEVAELSGCTVRTVERKLRRAQTWLSVFLGRT